MYTPEQVAEILQLSKNTVYELISKGELVAKKIGRLYRIPQSSINYAFSGMDEDLYLAKKTDKKNLNLIKDSLSKVRKQL